MSIGALLRVEIGRIFRDRMTWLIIGLSMLIPITGYALFTMTYADDTLAARNLANPAMMGALGGVILFAVLTLYRLSRAHTARTDILTDAVVSPVTMAIAQMVALLAAATVGGMLTMLVHLPYVAIKMGDVFSLGDYITVYLSLVMMGMWFGCLLAAAVYQVTRRVDLSIVIVLVLVLLSMTGLAQDKYLLRWAVPLVSALSDVYTNAVVIRTVVYSRLVWLLIFSGLWCLSLLGIRRYGKGLVGSTLRNVRRPVALALALCLAGGGVAAYAGQPYVNNAPRDVLIDYSNAKVQKHIYLERTDVSLTPKPASGELQGKAAYRLRNLNQEPVRISARLASGYAVKSLTINGMPVTFEDPDEAILHERKIYFDLPPGKDLELVIEYEGMPKIATPFERTLYANVISPTYIELTTSSVAPILSVEADADGAPFIAEVRLPGDMIPMTIEYGETEMIEELPSGDKLWRLTREGNRINLYAADFVVEDVSMGGMRILFYHARKHESLLREAKIQQAIWDVMDFCIRNYGALPYDDERPLRVMQSSVFQFGGFAGDGISVMGENIFAGNGLVDPLRGAQQYEVLAHELVHQWWGSSCFFLDEEEWSAEGFTVYTTYLLMKEKFGDAYAKQNYVDVWQATYDDYQEGFYARHPEYLDKLPEEYALNIRDAGIGTQRYSEMPLKIMKAAELLGGEERMAEIMRTLFEGNGGIQILTYDMFLQACGLTKEDLAL